MGTAIPRRRTGPGPARHGKAGRASSRRTQTTQIANYKGHYGKGPIRISAHWSRLDRGRMEINNQEDSCEGTKDPHATSRDYEPTGNNMNSHTHTHTHATAHHHKHTHTHTNTHAFFCVFLP
jgi:hypothetical protein